MKQKCLLVLSCCLMIFSAQAQEREWEIAKHKRRVEEQKRLDTLAIMQNKYVPSVLLKLKTQFPVQHALDIEFVTEAKISVRASIGQFSRFYTLVALENLARQDENQDVSQDFFKDRLRNGLVIELGSNYFFLKRGYYAGLNLQFQRFSLSGTLEELVENFDPNDTQGFGNDIQEQLEGNENLRNFYEQSTVYPTFSPVQMGFSLGKRFHFKKHPNLGLHFELGYSFNILPRVKVETGNPITQNIMDGSVNPLIQNSAAESFSSFHYPTISFGISAGLGKIIRPKIP